jgi:plastocyanin
LILYHGNGEFIDTVSWKCVIMRKFSATGILLSLALAIYTVCLPINYLTYPRIARAAGEAVTIHITGPTQPPGFLPALLTVHVYDTVIFVNPSNQGNSNANYAIVADDGSFSSPMIAPGKQWVVTFNTPGEHEYHTSTHSPHMVGVIIVVPNSVSLLPTPVPAIESTVIALIKAGKTPPDTIIVPSLTPAPAQKQQALATSLFSGWLLPVLLIAGAVVALLGLAVAFFYLIRVLRRRLRKKVRHDDDEDEEDDNDD